MQPERPHPRGLRAQYPSRGLDRRQQRPAGRRSFGVTAFRPSTLLGASRNSAPPCSASSGRPAAWARRCGRSSRSWCAPWRRRRARPAAPPSRWWRRRCVPAALMVLQGVTRQTCRVNAAVRQCVAAAWQQAACRCCCGALGGILSAEPRRAHPNERRPAVATRSCLCLCVLICTVAAVPGVPLEPGLLGGPQVR